MFERRLKVFLGVLLLFTFVLLVRAAQLQVVHREKWSSRAVDALKNSSYLDTTRGEILDVRGRRIAIDEPCVDACVDYRALTPEPDAKWVTEVARKRLGRQYDAAAWAQVPRAQRKTLLEQAERDVRDDVSKMWGRLAKVADKPLPEIEEARQSIVEKVRMRQRYVWYRNYELAMEKQKRGAQAAATQPAPAWRKWLLGEADDELDVDNFELNVSEETEAHVILAGVPTSVQTELGKYSDRFPGLELRPGTHRIYPYGPAGCHVIGRLAKVTADDRKDKSNPVTDPLRRYEPNDMIGRGGIEGLAEKVLRGTRGRIDRYEGMEIGSAAQVPGLNVKASIDIELQQEVQALFNAVPIKTKTPDNPEGVIEKIPMHGAAVVIDVKTGEVRVMASAPGYDPNTFDDNYARLSDPNDLHVPLLNRATQAQREPGSTVKPMVGLAAVASGVRRPDEGYECIGYMVVNGHPVNQGRCWVNSMFHDQLCDIARRGEECRRFPCPAVAHHPVPSGAPHLNGVLTLPEALERSCNPYFESIAAALGPQQLSDWYRRFGLGRKTGVGIIETAGRVPASDEATTRSSVGGIANWMAGIGQGPVSASPLQMANVAATIARGGVWVRPRLLTEKSAADVGPITSDPDRVDLMLPPEAIRAVKEGMVRVVNNKAGSGSAARREDMIVAGKTGSATASPTKVNVIDPVTGQVVRGPDGERKRDYLRPSTLADPNPAAPWYRGSGSDGTDLTHSWFIGFAPADNPQIAFAVLVEYGGGGSGAAGTVAKDIIQLCIDHKYLEVPAARGIPPVAAGRELLRDLR